MFRQSNSSYGEMVKKSPFIQALLRGNCLLMVI
jgi:hypothetical protein